MYNNSMNSSTQKNNFMLIAILAFVVVSIFVYKSLAKNLDTSSTNIKQESPFEKSEQIVSTEYKDGTYTSTGTYVSPGGPEIVEVTLIIKNDIVESADFVGKADLPTSKFFQDKFAEGYKELVIGKKINEITVDKVAGSSLTPLGFNEALENIKSQAKA